MQDDFIRLAVSDDKRVKNEEKQIVIKLCFLTSFKLTRLESSPK